MKVTAMLLVPISLAGTCFASGMCEIVRDGVRTPFDGSGLSGLQVEKKSLVLANREFPSLNIVEKAFKGELQTCTVCTFAYISCREAGSR